MKKMILEAINVDGARLIGTAHGFDLFDILTYSAAQEFVIENSPHQAGNAYVHDQNTFNANINEQQHLYFFAQQDTNKVFGAAVKSDRTSSIIEIKGDPERASIHIHANFEFENAGHGDRSVYFNHRLPLYLIPNASFTHCQEALFIEDNTLKAIIPELVEDESISINLDNFDLNEISDEANSYGMHCDSVIIPDTIEEIGHQAFKNTDNIYVMNISEKRENWADDWSSAANVTWEYGISDEERERREAERAEAERLEQERQEQARREEEERARIEAERQAEEARLAAERELRKIRYKVEGKNITILGTRKGVKDLVIPERIENKPVTKVAAYAFYAMPDLQTVELPKTVNLIEQGAFADNNILRYVAYPANCRIGKNAFFHCESAKDPYMEQ